MATVEDGVRPADRSGSVRVWLAFDRGATLPPMSVVQLGDVTLRDGDHRVSVAKVLGAPSIRAIVTA